MRHGFDIARAGYLHGGVVEVRLRSVRRTAPVRKATSFLLRSIGESEPPEAPDWWAYLGSFGNDIFDDEESDDA